MSTFNSLTHGELLLKTWEYSFTEFITLCAQVRPLLIHVNGYKMCICMRLLLLRRLLFGTMYMHVAVSRLRVCMEEGVGAPLGAWRRQQYIRVYISSSYNIITKVTCYTKSMYMCSKKLSEI